MGMSSSQARLLSLTARMHDIEYKAQRIEAQKLQMANESKRVYEDYLNAIDMNKFVAKSMTTDGSLCDIPFTASTIYSYGQFNEQLVLTSPKGQIYVPSGFDTNYKNTDSLQEFLNNYVETGIISGNVHTSYDNPDYLDAVEKYNQALEAAPINYAIAHGEWEDRNASEIESLHNLYLNDYAAWEYDRDHFQESDVYQAWLDRLNANEIAHTNWENQQTQWNNFNNIDTENALDLIIEYNEDGSIKYDNGNLIFKGNYTNAQKATITALVNWAKTYPSADVAEANLQETINNTVADGNKTKAQTLNDDVNSIYHNCIENNTGNNYKNLYTEYLGNYYNTAIGENTTGADYYKPALAYIIGYYQYYDSVADDKCTKAVTEYDITVNTGSNNIFSNGSANRPDGRPWNWLPYCYVDENGNDKRDDNEMIYVDQNGNGVLDAEEMYIYHDSDNNDTYNLDKNENDPTINIDQLFKEEDFVFLDTDNNGSISAEEKAQQIKNAKLAAYIRYCNKTADNDVLRNFVKKEYFNNGAHQHQTSIENTTVDLRLTDYVDYSYSYPSTMLYYGGFLDYNKDISATIPNIEIPVSLNIIGTTGSENGDHTLVLLNSSQVQSQQKRKNLADLSQIINETKVYTRELSDTEKSEYNTKSNYEILSGAYDRNGEIKSINQWAIDLYYLYQQWEQAMFSEYDSLVASGNTPLNQNGDKITSAYGYVQYGNCLDRKVEIEGENISFRNLQKSLTDFYDTIGNIDVHFIPEKYEENRSAVKAAINFPFTEPTFNEPAPVFNVTPPKETDAKYKYTSSDEPKLEDYMPNRNDYFYKNGELIPEKITIDVISEDFITFTDPKKVQWYVNIWAKMNGMDEAPSVDLTVYHDDATNKDLSVYSVQNCSKVNANYSTNPTTGYNQCENYIVIPDDMMNNNEWIYNVVSGAFGLIQKIDQKQHKFTDTSPAVMTEISEVPNEIAIKKAEAKYEADMKKIDLKDRKYDTDLASLENERNAIKQEIETLKTVAKDNVERTFKLFG